jgi:hypothetical protein
LVFWFSPRFIKKALGIHIGLHTPLGGGGGGGGGGKGFLTFKKGLGNDLNLVYPKLLVEK